MADNLQLSKHNCCHIFEFNIWRIKIENKNRIKIELMNIILFYTFIANEMYSYSFKITVCV